VLAQALTTAACADASVTLVDVLPDVPRQARRFVTEAIEQELVDDRRARLAALAGQANAGVAIETRVLRGRGGLALTQEVLRGGYDLLMRAHGRRPEPPVGPFGAVDMELLRQCPCPVWLVARDRPGPPRRILAAIDAAEPEEGPRGLNRTIVDLALRVSDPAAGPVTLLYAWDAFGEDLMRHRLAPEEFTAFLESFEHPAAEALSAFVGTLGPDRARVTPLLVKGLPDEVIPAYAREQAVDLVVMGTVARTGVAGLIAGNTAERVLQRLHVSVLALKPAGFVSPVAIRDDAAAPRR
jgi:nucleotide-binding universal stress UspA family protein